MTRRERERERSGIPSIVSVDRYANDLTRTVVSRSWRVVCLSVDGLAISMVVRIRSKRGEQDERKKRNTRHAVKTTICPTHRRGSRHRIMRAPSKPESSETCDIPAQGRAVDNEASRRQGGEERERGVALIREACPNLTRPVWVVLLWY